MSYLALRLGRCNARGMDADRSPLTIVISFALLLALPKLLNRDDNASDWTSIAVLAGLRLEMIPSSCRACTSPRIWAGVYLSDDDEGDDPQQLPRRTWSSMSK